MANDIKTDFFPKALKRSGQAIVFKKIPFMHDFKANDFCFYDSVKLHLTAMCNHFTTSLRHICHN